METIKNKVAIITGASGAIGKETVKLFLENGAKIMLVGRNEKKLQMLSNEYKSDRLAYCVADVTRSDDTKRYVETTLSKFKKIDIFFNNAGIEGVVKPMTEYPEKKFDEVIETNLKGVWLGCKYVLPKMENGGSVVITSSVAGLKGFEGLCAYVASKHAVVGIMRVAALESAHRQIRVNTIHPGPVNNRMMRSLETQINPDNAAEVQKGFENEIPFKRYAESGEIAQSVLFLASDASKYITGTMHVVDGGMLTG